MSILFRDIEKEEDFIKFGYTTLQLPDIKLIEKLNDVFNEFCAPKLPNNTDLYFSLMNDYSFNSKLKTKLSSLLQPAYDTWFKQYDNLVESFLVKRSKDLDELELHQDWSYVDERKHFCLCVWCPLLEISIENGGYFAISGSHHFYDNYRSHGYESARISFYSELNSCITNLQPKLGQVLAFNPSVFHGSFPNKTDHERPIMVSLIKPKVAPLVHYEKYDDHKAIEYIIDENCMLSEQRLMANGSKPKKYISKKMVDYIHPKIDIKNMLDYANKT